MASNVTAPTDSKSTPQRREGRSYHLFDHGLLVFERVLGPEDPHRLLIARVDLCTQPKCSCRDVGLLAVERDVAPGEHELGISSDELGALLAGPLAMNARLGLDVGLVEPDVYEGRVPLAPDWVDFVQAQVDGDLLDRLHDGWLRSKGLRPRRLDEVPRPKLAAGDLLGWYQAYPDDRRDKYLLRDALFMAEELYCVNPTCTCAEATIDFAELLERNRASSVGHVREPTRRAGHRIEAAARPRPRPHRAALGRFPGSASRSGRTPRGTQRPDRRAGASRGARPRCGAAPRRTQRSLPLRVWQEIQTLLRSLTTRPLTVVGRPVIHHHVQCAAS